MTKTRDAWLLACLLPLGAAAARAQVPERPGRFQLVDERLEAFLGLGEGAVDARRKELLGLLGRKYGLDFGDEAAWSGRGLLQVYRTLRAVPLRHAMARPQLQYIKPGRIGAFMGGGYNGEGVILPSGTNVKPATLAHELGHAVDKTLNGGSLDEYRRSPAGGGWIFHVRGESDWVHALLTRHHPWLCEEARRELAVYLESRAYVGDPKFERGSPERGEVERLLRETDALTRRVDDLLQGVVFRLALRRPGALDGPRGLYLLLRWHHKDLGWSKELFASVARKLAERVGAGESEWGTGTIGHILVDLDTTWLSDERAQEFQRATRAVAAGKVFALMRRRAPGAPIAGLPWLAELIRAHHEFVSASQALALARQWEEAATAGRSLDASRLAPLLSEPGDAGLVDAVFLGPVVRMIHAAYRGSASPLDERYYKNWGNGWLSFLGAAYGRQVTGYQFENPSEWFAEGYLHYLKDGDTTFLEENDRSLRQSDPATFEYFARIFRGPRGR